MTIDEAIAELVKRMRRLHPCDIEPFEMAISALRAQQEKNEPLTVEEVARAYLNICCYECSGDRSVGIQPCPFYKEPDISVTAGGHTKIIMGGCKLDAHRRPPKDGD